MLTEIVLKTTTKQALLNYFFAGIALMYGCLFIEQEYLSVIVSAFVFFMTFSRLHFSEMRRLFFVYSGFFIIEFITAFYQMINGFHISGTLGNSGVLAIFLSVNLPLYWFWGISVAMRENRLFHLRFYIYGILATLSVTCATIVMRAESRTALLIFVIAIAFFILFIKPHIRTGRKARTMATVLVCLVLAGGVIFIRHISLKKPMSTAGHELITKVALTHFKDNFWLGMGIGEFTRYYPDWQSEFFSTQQYPTERYLLSAGETYLIFNEYLQIFESLGFLQTMALFIPMVFFFTARSPLRTVELVSIKLAAFLVLFAGLFYYAFHVNAILIFLAAILAAGFKLDERRIFNINFGQLGIIKHPMANRAATLSLLFCGGCCAIYSYKVAEASYRWHASADNFISNEAQKSTYTDVYPLLNKDGKFLAEYGMLLAEDTARTADAIILLTKARSRFISRDVIEALGNAYRTKKDYRNSIECYKWLTNYIPNLFTPKLCLLELYIESDSLLEAKRIGESILNSTIKIPSPEVDRIKSQAAYLLRTHLVKQNKEKDLPSDLTTSIEDDHRISQAIRSTQKHNK